MDILRRYMERFVAAESTRDFPVMVSLSPLPSATTARWVKKNMSDARIPDALIKRLEDANDPENEGIAICAKLMQEISGIPGVSGVNLMTTGDPQAILAAIRASGLRNG
jgi:methylenetetrahydrofolate reductase (NADPH)